ncbi:MAG: methylenetetrahydrofolate reductase, partial [Oceanibaculum sp.]
MNARLWETIQRLEPMAPAFVSVTYGAGGSTRERTHDTVRRIVAETTLRPAAHLTCVSATKEEVLAVAEEYWQAGVRHIVALRGDPPAGMGAKFEAHPGGFTDSVDLIRGLRAH